MGRKFICFSSTKRYVFLLELPLIFLFVLAILFHNRVDSVFKLFPLEIVIGGLILFFPIYFVRIVLLYADEIRTVGVFSSRERSVIRKDKTLVLSLKKHGWLRVELFGRDSDEPALEWLRNDESYHPEDYCMLRAKAVGKKKAVEKILRFYGVSADDAKSILKDPSAAASTPDVSVTAEENDLMYQVKILFLTTVL